MSNITCFGLHKIDSKQKYSLKNVITTTVFITYLGLTSSAYGLEIKDENSIDSELPVFSTIEWSTNIETKDDKTVIFEPEYSTIPTPLAIDDNVSDEEKLEIYNNDMLANGIQSEGARGLLNWFIGPLCDLNIKPGNTIEDAAKAICIKNYSGTVGKEKWNKGKRYSKDLLDQLKEECGNIPNLKEIKDKWTKIGTSAKKLTPEDNDETLWVITYFMGYLVENDPTKVADEILMNNFENAELQKRLFDLRVEQFTKKKSLIYKGQ